MSDETNLAILPNVVVDDGVSVVAHLPGDFAVRVYRRLWPSTTAIAKNLTERQMIEYRQYLVCLRCGRPCAGTCERDERP